jgi:hypothetical protein
VTAALSDAEIESLTDSTGYTGVAVTIAERTVEASRQRRQ